jgi:hypothetical protein
VFTQGLNMLFKIQVICAT